MPQWWSHWSAISASTWQPSPSTPFGLIGVTLSIYLGFRNSAAYDRWWEGRKLWGTLVFEIRNLSRAVLALVEERTGQRLILMDALAFCHFLRGQLRRTDASAEARKFIGTEADELTGAANRADAMIRRMGVRIAEARKAGASTRSPSAF
jgi:ion channel-forming bestrophin family protein